MLSCKKQHHNKPNSKMIALHLINVLLTLFTLQFVLMIFLHLNVEHKVVCKRTTKARASSIKQLKTEHINLVGSPRKRWNKAIHKFVNRFMQNEETYLNEMRQLVDEIAIPRSVNTTGHRKVRKFLEKTIHSLGPNWLIDEDKFYSNTPLGRVRFCNIVATYVPNGYLCDSSSSSERNVTTIKQNAPKRIVLSCHYDSLHPLLVHEAHNSKFKNQKRTEFVGATDAAVSCALLLSLARFMTPHLDKIWSNKFNHVKDTAPILQLIFFDGEEALLNTSNQNKHKIGQLTSKLNDYNNNFGKSDSLYGSRHLARKWDQHKISVTTQQSQQQQQLHRRHRQVQSNKFRKIKLSRTGRQMIANRLRACTLDVVDKLVDITSTKCEHNVSSNVSRFGAHQTNDSSISFINSNDLTKRQNAATTDCASSNATIQSENDLNRLAINSDELLAALHNNDDIRLLLLLDLLGGSSPRFYNTNLQTSQHFARLAQIERQIMAIDGGHMHSGTKAFFQTTPQFLLSLVRDDHLPFVVRNVPVLHLIPNPFPRTWHRTSDNLDNLNYDTIHRLMMILQAFLLDSFQLLL